MSRQARATPTIVAALLLAGACSSNGGSGADADDTGNPVELVTHDYIELDDIGRISRFRSGVGHEFVDDFEASCSRFVLFLETL